MLDKALSNPWATVAVAVMVFGGSLMLFPVIGFSLFPSSEKPQFMIDISTPSQSSLAYTDSITRTVEDELIAYPQIQYFATNVGKGNPRIYYNEIPSNERTDYAQLFVQLQPYTSSDKKLELIEELREKWSRFPGAKVEVKNFEQGPPISAPVEVRLFGDNLDTLRTLAARVEKVLEQTDGTIYVSNPVAYLKSDIKVAVNKDKAQMLGIPTIMIDRTVRLAVAGLSIGKFADEKGKDVKILLTKGNTGTPTLEALTNLYVNNQQGRAIPLSLNVTQR